ncbi:MAG: recombinase family protein [Legionellaceae bacterium]|nr:recombinase family protein [Legionellaceae bacterium]
MIIGYARVSTQAQDAALQLDALKAAGCSRIYEEKLSGASKNRPELTHCLAALREGDTLTVWRLDRLGRSLKDLVQIVSDLESQNINFKSLTEAIDTSTAGGKLIFHIFCSLAEFERRLIKERTQAGLKAARARGRLGGRPSKLSAADLQKARAMLADPDQTVKEVARHFSVTRATLYRNLASPKKE